MIACGVWSNMTLLETIAVPERHERESVCKDKQDKGGEIEGRGMVEAARQVTVQEGAAARAQRLAAFGHGDDAMRAVARMTGDQPVGCITRYLPSSRTCHCEFIPFFGHFLPRAA